MRNYLKILLVFALSVAAVSFLGACGGGGGGDNGGGGTGRQWTYMVYMGADNNLSDAGIGDIAEMAKVGSDSNVAIVLQAEFSQYYSGSSVPSDTRRVLVPAGTENDVLSASTSIGNVDMGSPATLTAFITWATTNYPAQHYALVIWDHGAGWKDRSPQATSSLFRGAVQDQTSGTFMSLPDLAKGVRDANVHLDIINFDACLMAMYEVAYEFKGLVDYMVFSEETEPGEGDPYDTILGNLTGTPSMSANQLASTIVNRYDDFYAINNRGATTKSAVDMSQIDLLDTKILALAKALTSDPGSSSVVLAAQNNTQHYEYTSNHDIYDFASYLNAPSSTAAAGVKTAASEVMTVVNTMVIANRTNPDGDSSTNHGLAIYLPTANETNSSDLSEYGLLACNTTTRQSATGTWGAYIETLLGPGGGNVSYAQGGFAIYLWWEDAAGGGAGSCDADLDLIVWEPDVDWQSTGNGTWNYIWNGQTTTNGFFSMDSWESGYSAEYYAANAQVYYGDYYFLVNYWYDGSCTSARAHLEWYDPDLQIWFELNSANTNSYYGFSLTYPSPQIMSRVSMWPGGGTLLGLNNYTDYWVPDITWQARVAGAPLVLDPGAFTFGRNSGMSLRKRVDLIQPGSN